MLPLTSHGRMGMSKFMQAQVAAQALEVGLTLGFHQDVYDVVTGPDMQSL
jgi:hypothetical protein